MSTVGLERTQIRMLVAGAVGTTVAIAMWELLVRALNVRPFVLQAPSRILEELVNDPGLYTRAALVTARHALVGVAIGLGCSLLLGATLAAWRFLEDALQPILILILVTPWVSYFVSLVIWLGPGDPPVIFLVAFVTTPVLTFATVAGLRSADPAARELLRSVNAPAWEVWWRLRLPSALPTLFATSKFGVGLALAAAYFGEGGSLRAAGLGYLGRSAANFSAGTALWATIATTALLGVTILTLLTITERIVLNWHPSQRSALTP